MVLSFFVGWQPYMGQVWWMEMLAVSSWEECSQGIKTDSSLLQTCLHKIWLYYLATKVWAGDEFSTKIKVTRCSKDLENYFLCDFPSIVCESGFYVRGWTQLYIYFRYYCNVLQGPYVIDHYSCW